MPKLTPDEAMHITSATMFDADILESHAVSTELNRSAEGPQIARRWPAPNKRGPCSCDTEPPLHENQPSHHPRHPHEKPLKVRQNASNRTPPLHPAAPVLMRLRPWRKFESKEPYIAGRCGGGTTARAGPKWCFFLHL